MANDTLARALALSAGQGSQGPMGPTGPQGPMGPTGVQGEIGPQGPTGVPGEDGSIVSVSAAGTATDEVQYITIDGVEKKLAGGGGTTYIAGSGINITDNVISTTGQSDFITYTTTAPTADNPDGLKFVILSSEPATKYNGWFYIITG